MRVAIPDPKPNGLPMREDRPIMIWVCEACGKISRAKRKPRYHRRFLRGLVADGAGTPDLTGPERATRLGFQVLEVVEARSWTSYRQSPTEPYLQEPYDDEFEPEAAWIACGPFEKWEARRS